MAELLGTISAIVGIAGACVTLGQKLTDCIETVSYAEEDVETIISEVNIFSSLLTSFASIMKELATNQRGASAMVQAVTQQDLVVQIHQQSNLVRRRIREFLKKLRSLDRNSGSSMMQRGMSRIQWYFGKPEFTFLKTFLDAAKSNMQLLLTLVLLATYMDSHKNKRASELPELKRMSSQATLARKCCTLAESRFEMQDLANREERGTMRHLHSGLMEAQQEVQREAQRELQMEMVREVQKEMEHEVQREVVTSRFW